MKIMKITKSNTIIRVAGCLMSALIIDAQNMVSAAPGVSLGQDGHQCIELEFTDAPHVAERPASERDVKAHNICSSTVVVTVCKAGTSSCVSAQLDGGDRETVMQTPNFHESYDFAACISPDPSNVNAIFIKDQGGLEFWSGRGPYRCVRPTN